MQLISSAAAFVANTCHACWLLLMPAAAPAVVHELEMVEAMEAGKANVDDLEMLEMVEAAAVVDEEGPQAPPPSPVYDDDDDDEELQLLSPAALMGAQVAVAKTDEDDSGPAAESDERARPMVTVGGAGPFNPWSISLRMRRPFISGGGTGWQPIIRSPHVVSRSPGTRLQSSPGRGTEGMPDVDV